VSIGVDQWGHELHAQIGDIAIDCLATDADILHVSFDVKRELGQIPPSCALAVWGLSEDTHAEIKATPELAATVSAGYMGAAKELFTGRVRKVETVRQGTDWILLVNSGDASEKTEKEKARLSIKEGTPNADVLKQLVKACGLKPGNSDLLGIPFATDLKFASGEDKLTRALSVNGSAIDELHYFCRSVGVVWSIEDGAFKGAIAGTPVAPGPLITKDTGLIEPMCHLDEKGHVVGTSLMLPELRPGVGFTVQSKLITGQFICVQVTHSGDTHANKWISQWRGVPPDGFGTVLSERYKVGTGV
jgi:hypothetical protein